MIGAWLSMLGALGAEGDLVETVVRFENGEARLALRDVSGDGVLDLVRVDEAGIAVFLLNEAGRYGVEPTSSLPWPGGRVGWDLTDLDGDGACDLILALGDSGVVRVHRFGDGSNGSAGFDGGTEVLRAPAVLPAGIFRVRFARDVDGDGRIDLVLPGTGAHRIFLARADGWAPPIEVAYDLDADYEVGDPSVLHGYFGQRVRVPWFRIEDVDGDGRPDLVSETGERVAFHLASPELDSEPTWVLDLEALRDELPERDGVDFDDLFSALDQVVSWRLADLDGEGARDLIVALGPKFRVYLGGARQGPGSTPDQVLKSSGNVLWSFVRRVDGDSLPDLQIVRGERVSVGRVLRSLILPSALDFELFTYRNEGGTFSRRPTRRNRVTVEIPRLLAFMDDAGGLMDRIEAQFDIRATRLPRVAGVPAKGDDVVDVAGKELVLYSGCAPAPTDLEVLVSDFEPEGFVESFFLADLDARGDGASRTIDIGDVGTYDFAPGAVMRAAYEGREPALRFPLVVRAKHVTELIARDLDGDGVSDIVVVGEEDGDWVVQFLVRR